MGRPLKIAKSQFVGTITGTTTGTNIVTFIPAITSTVNFTVGMPIVAATTVSNIIAGTTYWVLTMPSTTSMTLSSTPLDANINKTALALGTVGPVVVGFTVNLVDYGFNNPNGAANTYSVVGGNTGIYGKQVLAAVAIGRTGVGTVTLNGTAAKEMWGAGTNFATTLLVGSSVELADGTQVGHVAVVPGYIVVAVTDTEAVGNIIVAVDTSAMNALQPIVFDADIGNLTAGTVYWVRDILSPTDFTVSMQRNGSLVTLVDDSAVVTGHQDYVVMDAITPQHYALSAWTYADNESGFIVRQKGRSKFLVTGLTSGLTGVCYTADLAAAALVPGTMSISATTSAPATVLVERLSDHTARGFGNTDTATAYYASFNAAIAANATPSQPYGVITVNNS
jgi:hypothetical protein